ncbi:hypothetical protein [Paracoccus sp. (in: a-proteobacteria)]|uniref:hypothetical protein n=1 Tax=Paracoccus sp. TaxID=267 RepID=UPI003A872E7E
MAKPNNGKTDRAAAQGSSFADGGTQKIVLITAIVGLITAVIGLLTNILPRPDTPPEPPVPKPFAYSGLPETLTDPPGSSGTTAPAASSFIQETVDFPNARVRQVCGVAIAARARFDIVARQYQGVELHLPGTGFNRLDPAQIPLELAPGCFIVAAQEHEFSRGSFGVKITVYKE